jgi:hypothetical protein
VEAGYILNELWRHRRWLVVGVLVAGVFALSSVYHLPSMEKKDLQVGSASVQMLVDAEYSPVSRLDAPLEGLAARAALYSRLIKSTPVTERIAKELGVPAGYIATMGPDVTQNNNGREVKPEERSNELLVEGGTLALFASPLVELPIIQIAAQAPTADQAIALANAATKALAGYVAEGQRDVPEDRRVVVRRLGPAQGGTLYQGTDKTAAVLSFIGAFVFWCLLVLVVSRVRRSVREVRTTPQNLPEWLAGGLAPDAAGADTENGHASANGAGHESLERPPTLR